ncbi:MAG: hypothetical protein WCO00_08870 [Rhodospirillaceae bacterium]
MAENENTTESTEPTSPNTPTVRQDIGTVLLSLVDAMNDVQTGLTAFLNVAADNGSNFADTAHWMVNRIDADFGKALSHAQAAQNAWRFDAFKPSRDRTAEAEEAAARLRAFAAQEDLGEHPSVTTQKAIDGAVADAVFVLASAMRWGQFEPMVIGLRRAGVVAQGGAA